MSLPVLPVVNALLPRVRGGILEAVALDTYSATVFLRMGTGRDIVLCPWNQVAGRPFHIGVIARCRELYVRTLIDGQARECQVLHVKLEGQEQVKVQTFHKRESIIVGEAVELLDLKKIRGEYPTISGAGWYATDGYTETSSYQDVRVVINGVDVESKQHVRICGDLGGILSPEQAHTIEHAIIRSLNRWALCSPKSLIQCVEEETAELKRSVEWGIRYARPDLFGVTNSGICGNPLSNSAQIYMAEEFMAALQEGRSMLASVEQARQKAMSRLTSDMGLTTLDGVRILQGLKKGMFHDDTPLTITKAKKILARFPISPW